ncbi:MAG: hypothetical protein JXQ87_14965 [Bacteroidia bacterium]
MKKSILPILALSLFFLGSCWSSKNKTDTNPENTDNSRFIVSFYSPGDGINRTAKQKFISFLENLEPSLSYNEVKWGREGEVDYCFALTEMKKADQDAFVKSVKELLAKADKVKFSENSPCRNSR